MKTRILCLAVLSILVAIVFAGCGGGTDTPSAPPTTYVGNFHAVAMQFGDPASIDESTNVVTAISEADLWFTISGRLYETTNEMQTAGGIDPRTVTWSFRVKDTNGRYAPINPPYTVGDEHIKLYRPTTGDYLVTGTFMFEGQQFMTSPLNVIVVEGRG